MVKSDGWLISEGDEVRLLHPADKSDGGIANLTRYAQCPVVSARAMKLGEPPAKSAPQDSQTGHAGLSF
jgi:hypothetical protein